MLAFVVLASLAVAAFAGPCDNEAPKFYQCLKDSQPTPPPKVIGGPGGTQEGAKAAWEAKEKKRNDCFTTNGCPIPLRGAPKGDGKGEAKGEGKGVGSGVGKERNTERETMGKCMNASFANLEKCVGKDHFPAPPKPEHGGLGGPGPKCEQRPGGPPCPPECEQRPGGPPCPQPQPKCEQRPGGPPCPAECEQRPGGPPCPQPQPECEQRPGGPPCPQPQPECEQRPGGPPCPQPQPKCEQRPGGPPCPVLYGTKDDKGVCPKFEEVNKCLDNLKKEDHPPMPGGDQGLDPAVLCKKRQDEQRQAEQSCIKKMSPPCQKSYTESKAKACSCAKTEKPLFESCAGASAHPGMSDMFIKMVCDEDRCTQPPLKG